MLDLEMDRNWRDFHRIFMGEMVIASDLPGETEGQFLDKYLPVKQPPLRDSIIWQNKLVTQLDHGHIPMAVAKKTN